MKLREEERHLTFIMGLFGLWVRRLMASVSSQARSAVRAPLLSPCCRRTRLPECFLFIRRLAEGAESRESWLLIHCGESYEKSTILRRTFFNRSAGETKTHRRGNRCLHIYETQILYFVWEEAERGEATLLTLSLMLSLESPRPPSTEVFLLSSLSRWPNNFQSVDFGDLTGMETDALRKPQWNQPLL